MNTLEQLVQLRKSLELVFSPETAVPGTYDNKKHDGCSDYDVRINPNSSKGHCAAVAYVVRALFGGQYVSTTVDGDSRWYNRLVICGQEFDVDLTADQYGKYDNIMIRIPGTMFDGTARIREITDLKDEAVARGQLLLKKILKINEG